MQNRSRHGDPSWDSDGDAETPQTPQTQPESAGGGRPPGRTAVGAGAGQPDDGGSGDDPGGGLKLKVWRNIFQRCAQLAAFGGYMLTGMIEGLSGSRPTPPRWSMYRALPIELRDRLSLSVLNAIAHAASERRKLNAIHMGTEHLLLGIMAERFGLGATALKRSGVQIGQLRAHCKDCHLEEMGNEACLRVFKQADAIARANQAACITSVHLLLALLETTHSNALHVASSAGVNLSWLTDELNLIAKFAEPS